MIGKFTRTTVSTEAELGKGVGVGFNDTAGEQEEVLLAPMRTVSLADPGAQPFRYGSLFCGVDVLAEAWPRGEASFTIDERNRSSLVSNRSVSKTDHQRFERAPWKKLLRERLDVLVVGVTNSEALECRWMDLLVNPKTRTRGSVPPVVIILEKADHIFSPKGSTFADRRSRFGKRMAIFGYSGVTKLVSASACGAALWEEHFVTIYHHSTAPMHPGLSTRSLGSIGEGLPARSSENCLMPTGIPSQSWVKPAQAQWITAPDFPRRSNHVGTLGGRRVYEVAGPIASDATSLIRTTKGVRAVQPQEWLKLKGLPTSWDPTEDTLRSILARPGTHGWAAIGDALVGAPVASTVPPLSSDPRSDLHERFGVPTSGKRWKYTLPDLTIGGTWYRARVRKLKEAVRLEGGPPTWVTDGLADLDHHRTNYGPDGPQFLVVLWWEWPREHWTELREGASMNFMKPPVPGLVPNSEMDGEELTSACGYVDELKRLGVSPPATEPLVNNGPLFLVEKALASDGQSAGHRCISDMKKGRQNEVCVSDPSHMSSTQDILPLLCPNGYSGVIDASKFFHMFRTKPDERKYMGLIHPVTGEHLWYERFPMGSTNSPGASGRFGAAFLREVIDTDPRFRGVPMDNNMASHLRGLGYDPTVGIGRILVGEDGLPALLLWIHVDDVFLHGPTEDKVNAGMTHLLDTAVRLGLICQPAKTSPPAQVQKFCGFLYDTRGIPAIEVPPAKIAKALAMTDFILADPHRAFSRLTVAIVAGVLQALVPATQSNIGATFLRAVYDDLHQGLPLEKVGTRASYYLPMLLSEQGLICIRWWRTVLSEGLLSRRFQVLEEATLALAHGDGSGTGTGGTQKFVHASVGDRPSSLEAWMGTWNTFSPDSTSNWKELRTLLQVLEQEPLATSRFRGRRLYYCTDNSVTYDSVRKGSSRSPKLHALIMRLKILELQHNCILVVIHIPGVAMIQEGTDGQSRGIWTTPLTVSGGYRVSDLFRWAPPSVTLLEWARDRAAIQTPTQYWTWQTPESDWGLTPLVNSHTIWTLSPHTARQAMTQAIRAWIESPLTSSHIFIVPRFMQREFGRVNSHIQFLAQHSDLPLPLDFGPLVPFLLFYLPPFRRRVEDLRPLDATPKAAAPWWVRSEVQLLRGLS